ncbi:TIR-NBS-LRR disease resistance-like protein [Melia azedarach]|uniref:TIR-NBS-LRR disease resistance-like protein n=1 Tax=Melia azedarach TaxID=155640 RepID=A0ACC1Y6Z8_MELAZ|nr:TIR-NBS-LRR disease resistance-like protein [Melia azedarach]
MASSSSFSFADIIPQMKYDVFLSYSGKDTRNNFTSHLYATLCRKKVETFIDNQLKRGGEISPSLLDVIEESKISVIIFSKQYASSRWCLDELVKILKCKNKYGQIVIPVFYHIDPSDVRNQTGIFGDSFSKLERQFQGRLEKLQRWRIALREAANISGFDSQVIRPDSLLVEEIANNILKRLDEISPSDNKELLVGVDSSIMEVESLLSVGSKHVYTLGIWGIGGIGKTTIASAIFNKISSHFEGSLFVHNVREEIEKTGGLTHLQREIFSSLLEDESMNIGSSNRGLNFKKERLGRKKVLIVFDDVTSSEQINFLMEGFDRFMLGSRVLITTRDKQVLKNYGVDNIYEVKALLHEASLKLFSQYAFKKNYPSMGYLELSNKIVKYAQGIPLALKVLGCSLFDKEEEYWQSTIKKLKRSAHMDIQKVLKISYDGLDDNEQNIFLDIACFFKGDDKDLVMKFLDASGFFAEKGISDLVDKSLLIISNKKITMHDLLQEMGREIVRQESIKDPGERSRLWYHKDVYEVLTKNTGTKSIEGIVLDMSKIKEIYLDPFTLTKINIQQLWNGVEHLGKLKYINVSNSKHLIKLPDLSLAPNLESLNLEGCTNLIEASSIQYLNKLVILNLRQCQSLNSLPTSFEYLSRVVRLNLENCSRLDSLPNSICKLKSLQHFNLSGCSKLERLPEEIGDLEALKELKAERTAIRKVPSSIISLSNLSRLSLKRDVEQPHMNLQLPHNVLGLHVLTSLKLSNCGITKLPENLGQLSSLKILILDGNNFERIPKSIIHLSNLFSLNISYCERLQSLPELPCDVSYMGAQYCTSMQSLGNLSILFTPTSRNSQTFNFTNCFKLDRNALKKIVKDALPKIQVMATEWRKENDKESYETPPSASLSFLGKEIPGWFTFKSLGSSITLKLRPGWFNDNFVSFALCAVVVSRRYYCNTGYLFRIFCECELKSSEDTNSSYLASGYLLGSADGYSGPYFFGSEHVFLGYDFNMYSNNGGCRGSFYNYTLATIKFYIDDIYGVTQCFGEDYSQVTKCAVRLLYAEDCGESGGSFSSDDKQEEPQSKRQKFFKKPPCDWFDFF